MADEKLTKTTGALLVAVREHVEQLIGGKHVDAGQLRLTVAARQEQAKQLVGAGSSLRDVAKKLGVGKSQVKRDVSPKGTMSSPKGTPKKEPPNPSTDPDEERKQQRWAATVNLIDGGRLSAVRVSLAIVKVGDWEGPKFDTCAAAARVARDFETCRRRQILSRGVYPSCHQRKSSGAELLKPSVDFFETRYNLIEQPLRRSRIAKLCGFHEVRLSNYKRTQGALEKVHAHRRIVDESLDRWVRLYRLDKLVLENTAPK